ncbi:hypothetical protein DYB37_003608 [Aphanomyces astaci]|uniref:polynucleotide adenylyltransferase n=1 Tax=Aphanomyces astaci TaxID=112090 RepID=A0A418EM01_APHAT|nr:hypothetical protein DYB37_003608 [Aphanomyces astaci]
MKDNTGAATSPTTANATAVLSMSSRKAKRSRALALALVDNNNRKTLLLDEASTPTVCSSTDCMLLSSDAALVATAEAQSKRGLESNNNDEFGSHVLGKRAFVHGVMSNNTTTATASTSCSSYKEALLLHTTASSNLHSSAWSTSSTTAAAMANMMSPTPSECGTVSAPTSPIDNNYQSPLNSNDNQHVSSTSGPPEKERETKTAWATDRALPPPPLPPSSPPSELSSRQDKTSAARLHPRAIRSAIAHAASQGVLTKSSKREMRQSMLRGATHVVLEGLRQRCHLQPLVAPPTSSGDLPPLPPPTEFERRHTNGLHKCLNSLAPSPQGDTLKAKHRVLVALDRLVDKWMVQLHHTCTASLFVGGSFYLKVDDADSDLDVVVLCPVEVTAADFFTVLPSLLSTSASVDHVVCMEEAYVPTISCTFHGDIHVDLLFSRFSQSVVPKHLPLHSDHILVGMDLTSVRSLSVPRVASLVLDLVPNPAAFRGCLRAVRAWAKARGLYSNKVGFLGGISWTVLVALVCQMFPHAVAGSLLHHFFNVLSTWQWPMPVMLAKPYDAGHGFAQWSPALHVHDRAHVMPILTPGYPTMNSAANVTHSTLRVLKEELTRGKLVLDDMAGQGLTSPVAWGPLFAPSDFFVRYDHYIHVRVAPSSDERSSAAGGAAQVGFVASRLRKLVDALQLTHHVLTVHPFPSYFGAPDHAFFVGFELATSQTGVGMAAGIVAPVLTYFTATELHTTSRSTCSQPPAALSYMTWQDLPSSVFPHGRAQAAGDRAKYKLSRAHTLHVAGSVSSISPPPSRLAPPMRMMTNDHRMPYHHHERWHANGGRHPPTPPPRLHPTVQTLVLHSN